MALTAESKLVTGEFGHAEFPANSLTYKRGSAIGIGTSGYAVLWTDANNENFLGLAQENGTSATSVIVRTLPDIIKGRDKSVAGVMVAGVTAVTDNGAPVYCSSDDIYSDCTLTPGNEVIGRVVKYVSAGFAWIQLLPRGYQGASAVIDGAIELTTGGLVDLNGVADALVLDADADTTISAPTDDQIDFEIAGADDFTMTANSFNVLTGSSIAMADSCQLKIGTGNDLTVSHDGSHTTATSATGNLILDNTAVTGATIARLGTDTSATKFEVQNNSESALFNVLGDSTAAFNARVTTTDGVASGTAKVIGGRSFAQTSASSAVAATASETVFDNGVFTIPASTIKAGTMVRVRFQGIATGTNSTDTLTIKLIIGGSETNTTGTALITTAATDVANDDIFVGEFVLVARAAPGASAACVGWGSYAIGTAGAATMRPAYIASTNLATNGALPVKVSAQWSVGLTANTCRLDNFTVEVI